MCSLINSFSTHHATLNQVTSSVQFLRVRRWTSVIPINVFVFPSEKAISVQCWTKWSHSQNCFEFGCCREKNVKNLLTLIQTSKYLFECQLVVNNILLMRAVRLWSCKNIVGFSLSSRLYFLYQFISSIYNCRIISYTVNPLHFKFKMDKVSL